MDLICVGDVMLDVRVDAGELARGGDVHGRVGLQPGGTSANAAVWAAASGATARVHGRVGADLVGDGSSHGARGPGCRGSARRATRAHPPGRCSSCSRRGSVRWWPTGERTRGSSPADLPAELEAGAVLVSGYLLLQDGAREAGVEAIRRSRAAWVAVEAASWPLVEAVGPRDSTTSPSGATVVLANEREAAVADLGRTRRRGARARRALPGGVRSNEEPPEPCWCWTERSTRRCRRAVEERDPTGAGDAFDGVLARVARARDRAGGGAAGGMSRRSERGGERIGVAGGAA